MLPLALTVVSGGVPSFPSLPDAMPKRHPALQSVRNVSVVHLRCPLQVAGHLTTVPADASMQTPRRVDITDFVKTGGGGGSRTLLIYRSLWQSDRVHGAPGRLLMQRAATTTRLLLLSQSKEELCCPNAGTSCINELLSSGQPLLPPARLWSPAPTLC